MATAAAQHHQPTFKLEPIEHALLTVAIMMAVLLQVLDTTIANVALPHMQASMSASRETINWVLTSYIVASAVVIPITGWLADRIGRRSLFIWSVIAFTATSVMCAMAQNLPQMVGFRVLQGVSGALLVPIAQATLFDINPPSRHARAMSIFGMGVMIGPILGPVLGGWLTENYNWRWVFLLNLPVGIICTLLLLRFMPASDIRRRQFDLLGFAFLAIALASLQMMLDRGQQLDWFDSTEVWIEAALFASCLWMFLVQLATARHPLFDPKIFSDGNFAVVLLYMTITGILLLGGLALLPPLLQSLLGYSVLDSGFLTMPRGVGTLISMMIAGRLTGKVDSRLLVLFGLVCLAYSLYQMTGFDLEMPRDPIIISGITQGFGVGFIYVPLQALAFASLPSSYRTTGAALLNLGRNIGGSVGISVVSLLLARNVQVSHSDLAAHITPYTFSRAPELFHGIEVADGVMLRLLDGEINRQALMIAYLDDFYLMMLATLVVVPLVAFLRPPRRTKDLPVLLSE